MKTNRMIVTNGIRLNLVECGKPEGPSMIFLHGFPDFHHGWRYQAAYFDEQKCHVLMPDQRGYNLSEKPKSVDDYSLDKLSRDIKGIIDSLGRTVWLIGHNWGGMVAWQIALKFPELLNGLVILNAPHPEVYWDYYKSKKIPFGKNAQNMFFQVPGIAEGLLKMGNWSHFSQQFQKNARKGTITEGDLEKYRQAWNQSGAFSAMLNWQRAFHQQKSYLKTSLKIEVPVLFIHGQQDTALSPQMVKESLSRCNQHYLKQLPNAGHWVQLDQHAVVNQLIHEFISHRSLL